MDTSGVSKNATLLALKKVKVRNRPLKLTKAEKRYCRMVDKKYGYDKGSLACWITKRRILAVEDAISRKIKKKKRFIQY